MRRSSRFGSPSALALLASSILVSFFACTSEKAADSDDGMGGAQEGDGGGPASSSGGRVDAHTGGSNSGGKSDLGSGGKSGPGMGGDDSASGGSESGVGGSSGGDEGTGSGGADAELPVGQVPLFVAIGFGGRRIISCDLGRSWVADTQESSTDDFHQPYSPKGLAYGNGVFVRATGWGSPGSAHTSRNGVDWTSSQFEPFFGGVGYDGEKFVMLGDRGSIVSDESGENWELHEDIRAPYRRQTDVFPELWASATDGEVAVKIGNGEWKDVTVCSGDIGTAIGSNGGFAIGNDILLAVGRDGSTCTANAKTGEGLGTGSIGSTLTGKPAFFDGLFWLARGGRLWSSPDGLTWDVQNLPSKIEFDLMIQSSAGVYVAIGTNGDSFFYSDDFQNWNRAEGPSGNDLTDLAFGMGESSSVCPAP